MHPLTWAEISLSALKNNLSVAKKAAPDSKIMAVIKSDAYGHGATQSATALADADCFAVARIEEAVQLRNNNVMKDIVVLSGLTSNEDVQTCIEQQLQPVIHSLRGVELLSTYTGKELLSVWLKIDTGMHRLGISTEQVAESIARLNSINNVHLLGVMSHLSDAEIIEHEANKKQLNLFRSLTSEITTRSLANSAGILFHPQMHMEWIRPGIMLYGINPAKHDSDLTRSLLPVMTLKSRAISTRKVTTGERVGYNGLWKATSPTTIATIAAGYADGYPRHAGNGTTVLINGKQYPLAGRVSMDMITVDVGDDDIVAGDEVTLWGEGLSASIIAESAKTIAYQLFCGVTARVPRIYID